MTTQTISQESVEEYLAKANEQLLEIRRLEGIEESLATYPFKGSVSFGAAGIWGTIACDANFASGHEMRYQGSFWGVGIGGGISWGAGYSNVHPTMLKGDCDFGFVISPGSPSVVRVVWKHKNMTLAVFTGGGVGIGGATGNGSGTWYLK